MALTITQAKSFERAGKKLHPRDKQALDQAVMAVASNPQCGEEKKGDLAGVFVYKFKANEQEVLLAYRLMPDKAKPTSMVLLATGRHENFYTDLKR